MTVMAPWQGQLTDKIATPIVQKLIFQFFQCVYRSQKFPQRTCRVNLNESSSGLMIVRLFKGGDRSVALNNNWARPVMKITVVMLEIHYHTMAFSRLISTTTKRPFLLVRNGPCAILGRERGHWKVVAQKINWEIKSAQRRKMYHVSARGEKEFRQGKKGTPPPLYFYHCETSRLLTFSP